MGKGEIWAPIIVLIMLMAAFAGYVVVNQKGGENNDEDEGHEEESATLGEWFVFSVDDSDGLPDCDDQTKGRLYFVESESAFYVCKSNGWMFIDLTGEVGATGDPGQNGTSANIVQNLPPSVSIYRPTSIWGTEIYSSTTGDLLGYSDFHFNIFRTMLDVDGTITSSGWDLDLDGTIDQNSSGTNSVDSLSIPINRWALANTIIGANNIHERFLITNIAFIATDDDGATTIETHTILFDSWEDGSSGFDVGILSLWANNSASEGTNTSTATLNTYTAEDAADDANDATGADDTLIKMQMTGSDTLAWAFVDISLSVGDNYYTCSVAAGDDCVISQQSGDNDNAWEPGEYIFLSEADAEICSSSGCMVDIFVTSSGNTVAGDQTVIVN